LNTEEAKQFTRELITAFPGFESAAKDTPDIKATHSAWIVSWSDLTLDECKQALIQLQRDGGIGWDEYREPGPFIRRLVFEARKAGAQSERDRAQAVERERNQRAKRDYKGSPMAGALAKAIEMRESGRSEEEILATIQATFAGHQYDEPRYHCLACFDRGLVRVVRMDTMHKIQRLEFDANGLTIAHTYNVACTCHAGKQVQQRKPTNQGGRLPVYEPYQFCMWRDDGNDANHATEWLANRKPKNYDSSFERWAG
jgi:hypothetical protein